MLKIQSSCHTLVARLMHFWKQGLVVIKGNCDAELRAWWCFPGAQIPFWSLAGSVSIGDQINTTTGFLLPVAVVVILVCLFVCFFCNIIDLYQLLFNSFQEHWFPMTATSVIEAVKLEQVVGNDLV